jgi:uncharacterized membrane protein
VTRRYAAWAALTAVALVLVWPYLRGGSRLDVTGPVLVTHVVTAAVALILGPLQFILAGRGPHRVIGRVYLLAGVLPAGVTAVPVAVWSGRPVTQVGLTVAAVWWLVTGWLAYRAARRGEFAAHRDWMTRNFALTLLAVTARALVPLMVAISALFADGGVPPAERVASLIPIGQTVGWVVNLAVAEVVIRRRLVSAPGRTRRRPWPRPAPRRR